MSETALVSCLATLCSMVCLRLAEYSCFKTASLGNTIRGAEAKSSLKGPVPSRCHKDVLGIELDLDRKFSAEQNRLL